MSNINYLTRYLNPKKHERSEAGRNEYYFTRIDKDYIDADQFPDSENVTKILRGNLRVDPFGPFIEVPSSFSQQRLYVELTDENNVNYYFQKDIGGTIMYLTLENIVGGFNDNIYYEVFDDQDFIFIQQNEGLVYHKTQERLYSIHQRLREIILVSKRTLSYNPKDLGGLKNGRHELDFKDATGYTNGFWDQLLDNLSKGSAAAFIPPSRKRIIKLKLNSKKGELYWYPRYELTDKKTVKLTYDYHPHENDNTDISQENYAIELEFAHPVAFLAFMNLTYFNNGITPFEIHDDSGFRKVYVLQSYVWFVNSQLKKENSSLKDALMYIYYIPQDFFIKTQNLFTKTEDPDNILGKEFLWKVLTIALEKSVSNRGINTEDIIIKILFTLKGIQDYVEEGKEITRQELTDRYDHLLTRLLEKKTSDGQSFLNAMYSKLNTDDFVTYNKFIYSVWANSSYVNPEHPAFTKTSQLLKDGEKVTKNTPELLLPYQTNKLLGFYSSNMDIEFKNENIIVTPDESVIDNILRYTPSFLPPLLPKSGSSIISELAEELLEEDWSYEYHPLQPVFLVDPYKDKAIKLQSLAPILLLKANEDKSFWSNVETTAEYAFDILTTFSGVGNLTKFRRLARIVDKASELNKSTEFINKYRLWKGVKGVSAGVEITVGSVNILLKATGIKNSEFARALGEYLFWIEIVAMVGEGIPGALKGIQKASKALLKKPDLIIDIEKKALKEISEAAIKNLDHGAKEAISVLKELLEQAGVFARQSWDITKEIGKRITDDLDSLGAELFKITGLDEDAVFRFLKGGGDPPFGTAQAITPSGARVNLDLVATYQGKTIFYGTNKQFDSFAKKLKEVHESGVGIGGRAGGKKALKNHLDELAENLSLKHKDVLNKRNLQIEKGSAQIYIDLVELIEGKKVIRFRGTVDEMNNVMRMLAKSDDEIKKILDNIIDEVRITKGFNPKKKALKKLRQAGIFIKSSARGLVPDFLSTPQFLYRGNPKYGKIKIKLTGMDDLDFRAAYEAAGLLDQIPKGKRKISGYTWHHMDDYNPITGECTMQLVETAIHAKTSTHIGGMGLLNKLFDVVRK